jgi:ABC-type nickel/cobalt efflux system permease component RcnA
MSARVPLDVDLEDKLLYGLTPIRLVYLVVGMLAAFSVWSAQWAPAWVRGACALLIASLGAVAAWGRWRGRPADGWLIDIASYVLATYRLRWAMPRPRR